MELEVLPLCELLANVDRWVSPSNTSDDPPKLTVQERVLLWIKFMQAVPENFVTGFF